MHNKGFTLIELVVTISILGIILSLAVLIIDRDMFYMEKMADEFVTDVRYVQNESKKSPSNTYEISIDENNSCYHVKKSTDTEKTVKFKDRYQIDYNNGNRIGFTYDGSPKNSGTFTITDTKAEKIKEITIIPATGRTVIKEHKD